MEQLLLKGSVYCCSIIYLVRQALDLGWQNVEMQGELDDV